MALHALNERVVQHVEDQIKFQCDLMQSIVGGGTGKRGLA